MQTIPTAVFSSLKARLKENKVGRIILGADEIAEWPAGLFDEFIRAKALKPVEPATTLECRGCEEACMMPVEILPTEGKHPARAFIACDKRDDVGRVRVVFSRLGQWQITQAGFENLEAMMIVSGDDDSAKPIRRIKAPAAFRCALEALLIEIEGRAKRQGVPFDRNAMPGRKIDLLAVAGKFDASLDTAERTFDDYLSGLCRFRKGSRATDFYLNLFPEYRPSATK